MRVLRGSVLVGALAAGAFLWGCGESPSAPAFPEVEDDGLEVAYDELVERLRGDTEVDSEDSAAEADRPPDGDGKESTRS